MPRAAAPRRRAGAGPRARGGRLGLERRDAVRPHRRPPERQLERGTRARQRVDQRRDRAGIDIAQEVQRDVQLRVRLRAGARCPGPGVAAARQHVHASRRRARARGTAAPRRFRPASCVVRRAEPRQHAPIEPRITASASSSIAVGWALTMTTRAPRCCATGTTPATGYTCSVVPTASSRSASAAARIARRSPPAPAPARTRSCRSSGCRRSAAVRIGLAGTHALEHLAHRRALAATPAHHAPDRAVHLDHLAPARCRRAGAARRCSG